MGDEQLSLFDFGYDEKGEYVNFKEVEAEQERLKKEEEKRLKLSEEENQKLIDEWLNTRQPLETFSERKIIATAFRYYGEPIDFEYVKKKVEKIMSTRCFHYYNMKTLMSIQSYVDEDNTMKIMFENENTGHFLMLRYHMEEDQLDDILRGKKEIGFSACAIDVFDRNGEIIHQYSDEDYRKDIRQIVVCDEWHALDVGKPIMDYIKKPKMFCEITAKLPDIIENLKNYYGEDDEEEENEEE